MKGNLRPILEQYVFDDEGEEFEIRATEPGGAVKLGVSFQVFKEYWQAKKLGTPSFDDLAAMTREDSIPIYDFKFWQPMMGDDFPLGVDYVIFDPVMHSGLTGGQKIISAAFNIHNTPMSWHDLVYAASRVDAGWLVDRVCDARIVHMMESPDWDKYEEGWTARVGRVRERAKKMATDPPRAG